MSKPQANVIGGASGARPDLTADQSMRLWMDLMETTDQLLRSGLAASLKPGEDFQDCYRRWHEEKAREHDAMIWNLARRLQAAQDKHAS